MFPSDLLQPIFLPLLLSRSCMFSPRSPFQLTYQFSVPSLSSSSCSCSSSSSSTFTISFPLRYFHFFLISCPALLSSSTPSSAVSLLFSFFHDSSVAVADASLPFYSACSHDTYLLPVRLLLEPLCSDSAFILCSVLEQPHTASVAHS